MKRYLRRKLVQAMLVAGIALPLYVLAQDVVSFPSKSISLIVPFAAGSATDLGARIFARGLSEEFKQPVIVDNRPGGAGTIAMDYVSRGPADGYKLLYVGGGSLSQTFFSRKLNSDLLRDLTPVIQLGRGEFYLYVRGDLAVSTVQEFLNLLQNSPGKYNYASIATTQMMPMEMLLHRAKVQMTHVAYKSPGQVLQAFAANDIVATVAGPVGYENFLAYGKIKPLMVFGNQRSPDAPNLPCAAESGFPELRAPYSFAVWAPAGTDNNVISKLNLAFNRVLMHPDAKEFIARQGAIQTGGTMKRQMDYVKSEQAYWAEAASVSKFVPE